MREHPHGPGVKYVWSVETISHRKSIASDLVLKFRSKTKPVVSGVDPEYLHKGDLAHQGPFGLGPPGRSNKNGRPFVVPRTIRKCPLRSRSNSRRWCQEFVPRTFVLRRIKQCCASIQRKLSLSSMGVTRRLRFFSARESFGASSGWSSRFQSLNETAPRGVPSSVNASFKCRYAPRRVGPLSGPAP